MALTYSGISECKSMFAESGNAVIGIMKGAFGMLAFIS